MLNLAHYDIEKNVHLYRQGDLRIAYDVHSGSLHLLDEKTYAYIHELAALQKEEGTNTPDLLTKAGKDLLPQEKEEILQELTGLQQEHLLFSEEGAQTGPVYPEEPLIKAMCLHVAHDCNLRCQYCFAETGSFGGRRGLMEAETGKKAIDFLLSHNGNRPHCEVDFFGGEPLLNFSVVQELVRYGREEAQKRGKKIKFTLTTNGLLLDEKVANYLEQEEISVVLSLDGRQEVNDRMRPYANGKGSYEQIVKNTLPFIEKRPDTSPYAIGKYYYVRGTFTHHNLDFYRDVLHMADLGIKRISVEPVVTSPQEALALREEDMPAVFESYDILAEKAREYQQAGKEFTFFHFNAGLDDGPCLPKRLSGCGAGHEYIAISPEGDIYPCHQFVGQEKYKLGSLEQDRPSLDPQWIQAFRGAHIYAKKECRSCWARFSCSGGCHAANQEATGELTKVHPMSCILQKKRLEVAFYLKVREALDKNLV